MLQRKSTYVKEAGRNGIVLVAEQDRDSQAKTILKSKKFDSLHPGFKYKEEEHEASRHLFGETKETKKN